MDHTHYPAKASDEDRSSENTEREFSEATNRVYEKYGNDLSAFYRDVKKSIKVEKCDSPKPKRWGASD
jgi:hypothetical protein